jgi:hypothetical protein
MENGHGGWKMLVRKKRKGSVQKRLAKMQKKKKNAQVKAELVMHARDEGKKHR